MNAGVSIHGRVTAWFDVHEKNVNQFLWLISVEHLWFWTNKLDNTLSHHHENTKKIRKYLLDECCSSL